MSDLHSLSLSGLQYVSLYMTVRECISHLTCLGAHGSFGSHDVGIGGLGPEWATGCTIIEEIAPT